MEKQHKQRSLRDRAGRLQRGKWDYRHNGNASLPCHNIFQHANSIHVMELCSLTSATGL